MSMPVHRMISEIQRGSLNMDGERRDARDMRLSNSFGIDGGAGTHGVGTGQLVYHLTGDSRRLWQYYTGTVPV